MHYVLDGNNIIKHRIWNSGKQKTDDRLVLIIALDEYQKHHNSVRFTVVFDGWSDNLHQSPNIKIIWSHDQTADDVIIKKIPVLGKDTIVVSNDNQIRKQAKFAELKTLTVEEFIAILESSKQKKRSTITEEKNIPYKDVLAIRNELEKCYEKNPPQTDRIRKIRKRFQKFF